MLGMMMFGSDMMAQMGGMQMGGGFMAVCALWTVLVAAALIGLIVLLSRGTGATGHREVRSASMRSPQPHSGDLSGRRYRQATTQHSLPTNSARRQRNAVP
jgi:hypothetical protein